jgi:hypothetical protein
MNKIYLIKSLNEGVYKIGVSKNPNKRLSELQTGNPYPIEILYLYESNMAYKIESVLHNRYSHFNTQLEWFELSIKEEVSFLETCASIENMLVELKNSGNPFI